ncbi:uncharacterized protein PGTG_21896 [Puccinia graminis f. sp. tritici CRL 75-36-700-3]|uniref:Uncharacterized protein n=1 Tax=Puccinia graminis f. sp. tritici (strain CRL 75-36-700-3 / race SCCL) TaxID=418459 RepID=H6QTC7_PUCGT|nr:uncharacterized protein PGTG_21896 [Puccinia graminis f. sp. tritici CRL 75-36-700-3]EHS64146.1 hypothetical protein PGTG_21896 [Puccinia graminis f. sp. tritici CRL 75-36-700-3]
MGQQAKISPPTSLVTIYQTIWPSVLVCYREIRELQRCCAEQLNRLKPSEPWKRHCN